jgi:hypothetical protein
MLNILPTTFKTTEHRTGQDLIDGQKALMRASDDASLAGPMFLVFETFFSLMTRRRTTAGAREYIYLVGPWRAREPRDVPSTALDHAWGR